MSEFDEVNGYKITVQKVIKTVKNRKYNWNIYVHIPFPTISIIICNSVESDKFQITHNESMPEAEQLPLQGAAVLGRENEWQGALGRLRCCVMVWMGLDCKGPLSVQLKSGHFSVLSVYLDKTFE